MLKHLQSYVVHYAAVIAGLCAVVSKLNPALLGPYSGFVGAAAIGVTIANALGIKPETVAKVAVLVLLAMPLGMLSGCATVQKAMSNPASATAVQAGIDLAVGTMIQTTAKTPGAQAAEAAQIQAIAGDLEAVLSGQQVTLVALDTLLQSKINGANMPPQDKAAAMLLASTIQSIILQQIQGQIGSTPPLAPAQTVAVKAVLDDAIQAASFYAVHARAAMRADMARP